MQPEKSQTALAATDMKNDDKNQGAVLPLPADKNQQRGAGGNELGRSGGPSDNNARLTWQELAQRLGIAPRTLRRFRREQGGPAMPDLDQWHKFLTHRAAETGDPARAEEAIRDELDKVFEITEAEARKEENKQRARGRKNEHRAIAGGFHRPALAPPQTFGSVPRIAPSAAVT